ncbi:hypothetical protein C8R47DRAFT_1137216 [Mycena vitilis]|nr:hypothetical protein C8R47DRAFT_1137216 [Mycena vitilis]
MLRSRPPLLLGVLIAGATRVAAQNNSSNTSRSSAVAGVLLAVIILMLCLCGVRRRANRPARMPLATPNHFTNSNYGNSGVPMFPPALAGRPPTLPDSEYPPPAAADYAPPPYVKEGGDAPALYAPPPGPPPGIDAAYSPVRSFGLRCNHITDFAEASRAPASRTHLQQLGGFQWRLSAPSCVLASQTRGAPQSWRTMARSFSPRPTRTISPISPRTRKSCITYSLDLMYLSLLLNTF